MKVMSYAEFQWNNSAFYETNHKNFSQEIFAEKKSGKFTQQIAMKENT